MKEKKYKASNDNKLEAIETRLKDVDTYSLEWADLILEAAAIVSGADRKELERELTESLKELPLEFDADGPAFYRGVMAGLSIGRELVHRNFGTSPQFLHSVAMTDACAVLIVHDIEERMKEGRPKIAYS